MLISKFDVRVMSIVCCSINEMLKQTKKQKKTKIMFTELATLKVTENN